MSEAESKRLIDWLADVDGDDEVLDLFRSGRLREAVDRAAEKHPGGNAHKDLLKRNKLKEICEQLEEETESAESVHQFWVLVRI